MKELPRCSTDMGSFTDIEKRLDQLLNNRSNWPHLEKILLVVRAVKNTMPKIYTPLSQSFVRNHFPTFSSNDDEIFYKSSAVLRVRDALVVL